MTYLTRPIYDENYGIVLPDSGKIVYPFQMSDDEIRGILKFYPHLTALFYPDYVPPPIQTEAKNEQLESIKLNFQPLLEIQNSIKALVETFISLLVYYIIF